MVARARLLKTNDGKIKRLEAKMIGITPAWLTFRGRNCLVPPKTRRPRTCLADWVGIRRWLSVIAITPTTTAMKSPIKSKIVMMPYLPGSGLSFEVELSHRPFGRDRDRQPRQDARHDQEADSVADPVLVDLLADPHQENRAGRHDADAHQSRARSRGNRGKTTFICGLIMYCTQNALWIAQRTTVA